MKTTLRYIGKYQRFGMLSEVETPLVPQLLASGEWEGVDLKEDTISQFRKELENLKGIGKKTADVILKLATNWSDLKLIPVPLLKQKLPDDDVEKLLAELSKRS